MKKLSLNSLTLFEKVDLLSDSIGDYETLDSIIGACPGGGTVMEQLISSVVEPGDEVCDNLVSWYLEHYSLVDAFECFLAMNIGIEHVVDEVLVSTGLDYYDEPEFETYGEYLSYRNA